MDTLTPSIPPALADALARARRVVVFTGAGVSAESGISTFRDPLTGLWSRFDARALATPEAFAAQPDLVWGWYEWRRAHVARAEPNAAHRAIAALARRVPGLALITQNVDNLHERAGSDSVIHLHGSLHAPRCSACGRPRRSPPRRRPNPPKAAPSRHRPASIAARRYAPASSGSAKACRPAPGNRHSTPPATATCS